MLRADVFRPIKNGRYPVLLSYGPYGKWLHFEDGYKTAWTRMVEQHPDVPVWTAAVDRELDENAYIRPGLGDAGDRVFGT